MANTPKKSTVKKKAAPKKVAMDKPVKLAPDFYTLRENWMAAKEEVAYQQRLLSRANGSQSSAADRQRQMDAVNVNLLKAHDAEKKAATAFTSAKKKAQRKARA